MKKLSDFANPIAEIKHDLVSERQQPVMSEQSGIEINKIFTQLRIIFPAWRSAFPDQKMLNAAKLQWSKAFLEARICTQEQISIGFNNARKSEIPFFPSPGQFIAWCKPTPESLGMPTVEQALHEVAHHRSSHPAVILAARATRFERETLSAIEYVPIFRRAYQLLVNRVLYGEDLNAEVLKGLPSKNDIQHSAEFYQQSGKRGVSLLKSLFKRGEQ